MLLNKKLKNEIENYLEIEFLFIIYLIDVIGIPIKSFSEIYDLKKRIENFTIIEEYIYANIEKVCSKKFKKNISSQRMSNFQLQIKETIEYEIIINKYRDQIELAYVKLLNLYNHL